MDNKTTRFRIQAGGLNFEIEGTQKFVQHQIEKHRPEIDAIVEELARLTKSGKLPAGTRRGRRGRPPKAAAKGGRGRRPGRQPVIIRDSSLRLKAAQKSQLKQRLAEIAKDGKLGKDATVFAIAYFLCGKILKSDNFSAGDVMAAHKQVGSLPCAPAPRAVDVVQMLRNLAAASIGKQWVARNADGTFSLTAKGKSVGASGKIVRPRGRRPKAKAAVKGAKRKGAKRGPGRPPKKRGPGRPKKKIAGKAARKTAGKKAARRGRPPKKRGPGRPRKNAR
jgi:hypothetical protein